MGEKRVIYPTHLHIDLQPNAYLSMDVKVMPEAMGYKYILVVVDDNTHYVSCFPLKECTAKAVANVILNEFCMKTGLPRRIMCELARSFASEIVQYLTRALGVELVFISAGNHHQNRTERYISSLQSTLIMTLKSKAELWPCFVAPATFSLNAFASPALENYSPHELHLKTGPVKVSRYQLNPQTGICRSIAEYVGAVKQKFDLIRDMLNKNQAKKQNEQYIKSARDAKSCKIKKGTLVYMLMPDASRLKDTRSKKVILNWVGPMIVYQMDGRGNAILQRIDGKLLCNVISTRRLKPAYIRTKTGDILTTKAEIMEQLKENNDPFAKELRRGLLPDYLEFEDAEGKQYQTTENLLVMTCPTGTENDPTIVLHPTTQKLTELSATELLSHISKRQNDPMQAGEYDLIKARFTNGNLCFLVSPSGKATSHAFYISCTEGVGSLKLLEEARTGALQVIGNPSNYKQTKTYVPRGPQNVNENEKGIKTGTNIGEHRTTHKGSTGSNNPRA